MGFIDPVILSQTDPDTRVAVWPVRAERDVPFAHGSGLNVLASIGGEEVEFVIETPNLIKAMGEALALDAEAALAKAEKEDEEIASLTAERDALLIDMADKNEEIEDLRSEVAELACQACSAPFHAVMIEFLSADNEVASVI